MKKEWFEPGPDGVNQLRAEVERLTAERDAARAQLEASELRAKLLEKSYDEQQAAMSEKEGVCMELRGEVERLQVELRHCKDERMAAEIERDAADEFVKRLTAERDALQARIDAGVRVWGSFSFGGICFAHESARDSSDTHTALLIDACPIDQPAPNADRGQP